MKLSRGLIKDVSVLFPANCEDNIVADGSAVFKKRREGRGSEGETQARAHAQKNTRISQSHSRPARRRRMSRIINVQVFLDRSISLRFSSSGDGKCHMQDLCRLRCASAATPKPPFLSASHTNSLRAFTPPLPPFGCALGHLVYAQ